MLLLVAAPAAIAATVDEVADALTSDGYYIEPDAEPVDEQELAAVVRNSEVGLRVVLLAATPPEGAPALAEDLLDEMGGGTVVVVTPEDVGTSASRADPGAVDRAFDRAEEQADSVEDLPGYLAAFDEALAGQAGSSGGL
ncbi:MAG: hypothetical protein GEU81_15060, partial [Nitriliruptorales bacterium]|nr:hypothetical protein [Nitriliruptorales bacterium]